MKYIYIVIVTCIFSSCDWLKQKTKETVNKSGEVIAKTGSEFIDGVSKGVEKTFQNEVIFSEALKTKGLKAGKIIIISTDSTSDNILSVYFIYDKDIHQKITAKLFSESGQEYGRAKQIVKGKKGDAQYLDFIFHKRTNIDGKGKVVFE